MLPNQSCSVVIFGSPEHLRLIQTFQGVCADVWPLQRYPGNAVFYRGISSGSLGARPVLGEPSSAGQARSAHLSCEGSPNPALPPCLPITTKLRRYLQLLFEAHNAVLMPPSKLASAFMSETSPVVALRWQYLCFCSLKPFTHANNCSEAKETT